MAIAKHIARPTQPAAVNTNDKNDRRNSKEYQGFDKVALNEIHEGLKQKRRKEVNPEKRERHKSDRA